jgi:hypothetical protein
MTPEAVVGTVVLRQKRSAPFSAVWFFVTLKSMVGIYGGDTSMQHTTQGLAVTRSSLIQR